MCFRRSGCAESAFLVEIVGRYVRGGHQRDAAIEQSAKKIAQDHRIADVADEQLVETQHACLASNLVRNQLQRISAILMFSKLVVHGLHEAVEVAALLVLERQ